MHRWRNDDDLGVWRLLEEVGLGWLLGIHG